MTIRHPPGRAGKVWLRDRLQAAVRGTELLERKQAVLVRERRRLRALTDQTALTWRQRYEDTIPATIRLLLLGGRAALERARVEAAGAAAEVSWTSAMGVTYPAHVAAVLPEPPDLNGPAALGAGIAVHRAALDAAVQHAAASFALERIDAELAGTSQRLRAVRDRLVPEIEQALRALELALDEAEREESMRGRWAHVEPNPVTTQEEASDR